MSRAEQSADTSGFHGYESPRAAAAGNQARVGALIAAIGYLSELLEDSNSDARETFYLATAIQACVEAAECKGQVVQEALDAMSEVSHG